MVMLTTRIATSEAIVSRAGGGEWCLGDSGGVWLGD